MKTDAEIWNDFKNEKEYALSHIYNTNIDFLFSFGRKFSNDEGLILDSIQDVFINLIKSRANLSPTDNIRLYLGKCLRRKLIRNSLKSSKTRYDNEYIFEEIALTTQDDTSKDELINDRIKLVNDAIHKLKQKQQEIIYYKLKCEMEYDQICDIMNISYDAARKLFSRAIENLKKQISQTNTH